MAEKKNNVIPPWIQVLIAILVGAFTLLNYMKDWLIEPFQNEIKAVEATSKSRFNEIEKRINVHCESDAVRFKHIEEEIEEHKIEVKSKESEQDKTCKDNNRCFR